jgi:hypothetical protein
MGNLWRRLLEGNFPLDRRELYEGKMGFCSFLSSWFRCHLVMSLSCLHAPSGVHLLTPQPSVGHTLEAERGRLSKCFTDSETWYSCTTEPSFRIVTPRFLLQGEMGLFYCFSFKQSGILLLGIENIPTIDSLVNRYY